MGRKYHLLIFDFHFYIWRFLPPALTKRIYAVMTDYKEKRQKPWNQRLFYHSCKHSEEVIRRFPPIKSIKKYLFFSWLHISFYNSRKIGFCPNVIAQKSHCQHKYPIFLDYFCKRIKENNSTLHFNRISFIHLSSPLFSITLPPPSHPRKLAGKSDSYHHFLSSIPLFQCFTWNIFPISLSQP